MPDTTSLSSFGFTPGNSFFNNFQPTGSAVNAAVAAVPRAPNPVLPPLAPGQTGSAATQVAANTGTSSSRAVVPNDWLGTANSGMGELLGEYGTARDAYDTTAYDTASKAQQARDLRVGMATANNAANEYTARVRQAGGVGAGGGLIKAEGILSAQDKAGKAEVDRAKYDMEQREAAATHAGQIAQVLASLRDNYLNALIGKDTTESGAQASSSSQISGKGGTGTLYGNPSQYVPTQGPLQTNIPNAPNAPDQWWAPSGMPGHG